MIIKTKNRIIKTRIPAPGTSKIIKSLQKNESRSMQGQLPIIWSKAEGHSLFDISGNKFIDFTSTIFVTNIGHSNTKLINNLRKALDKKLLHSYAYFNKSREKYLKNLIKFAGKNFEKAFLMSAGTEATEAALKLMRLYGQKNKKRRPGIICINGNWHGRTMGAQMMSGNEKQKEWIGYKDKNIHHIDFPYPWELNNISPKNFLKKSLDKLKKKIDLKKDVCGFMLETFQGWGAIFYPKEFVKEIANICKKNEILLTFDEMQSGFGRTGKKFGYEHYNVKPDLICCGKGMGGGVALSGVLGKKEIMDLPSIGEMSSTNSANPLACVAGMSVIDEIKSKKILEKVVKNGFYLNKGLNRIMKNNLNLINYVMGKGMVYALIFDKKINNIGEKLKKVCFNAMKNGLLVVYTGRESIKIGPPLTISKKAIEEGLEVLENEITKVFKDEVKR
ncbi:aspartate aminotransferase family protein [Candidatus Pelagibacter ubique]|nr:aspartate aminotransferase family protein [Candidatus Pelagibacter ubique]